ncbi:hypothetical protein COMA2_170127 [Candidatus Nitrospira nitrificans]|uniref:Uncharacterized protein n=1 Tax=Candidatus Nitrospira nitrificans TaxID=1742973 RepID=A0A0S4LFC2_9BACT|nr:hypothetical protein COMA2_170127 [Candidatus Nitrospira nitrificans]
MTLHFSNDNEFEKLTMMQLLDLMKH